MKTNWFVLAFLLIGTTLLAQPKAISEENFSIGKKIVLHSSVLNEDRTLNIALPLNFDKAKKYPVLYVLDGSANEDFLHIVGLCQFFNLQFKMPDFIIVGIGNVDRKRDFTFYTNLEELQKNFPTTGHSEKFISFIETELQPFITSNYLTEDTRYLIGQSLGGLLATEIVLKKPHLFTHYLIISPSLWWDKESLLKQAPKLLAAATKLPAYIYVSVGSEEDKIMRKEAKAIAEILKADKRLKVDFLEIMNENHATVLHKSIYEGFKKIFPYKE